MASAVLLTGGCDRFKANRGPAEGANAVSAQPLAPAKPATAAAGGAEASVTPMADRVAVIGVLNKRNGIERDVTMKPGMALRVRDDLIVRLRACEMTPPWEFDQWTGAFVQVDVRQPEGGWKRVFSGWLYKESPSLNVVEHAVYDVWPKSCVMRFPDAPQSSGKAAAGKVSGASAASSADQSPGGDEPSASASPSRRR